MSSEELLKKLPKELQNEQWVKTFVDDIIYESGDNLESYLNDVINYGCISGMVTLLIYYDDCRNIYIDNIDEMEDFIKENDLRIDESQPRYCGVCWACYEYLCYLIKQLIYGS